MIDANLIGLRAVIKVLVDKNVITSDEVKSEIAAQCRTQSESTAFADMLVTQIIGELA